MRFPSEKAQSEKLRQLRRSPTFKSQFEKKMSSKQNQEGVLREVGEKQKQQANRRKCLNKEEVVNNVKGHWAVK